MYYKVTKTKIIPVVDSYTINFHGDKYIAIRENILDDEYKEYPANKLEEFGFIKGKKKAEEFRKTLNKGE